FSRDWSSDVCSSDLIHVCMAAGCLSNRADLVKQQLEKQIAANGLERRCTVKGVGCMGLCAAGPLVSIQPKGIMYQEVKPTDAPRSEERRVGKGCRQR